MFWLGKKRRPWHAHYRVEWYSTAELERFLQAERDIISHRSQPVWRHIQHAALLETEIARRTTTNNQMDSNR